MRKLAFHAQSTRQRRARKPRRPLVLFGTISFTFFVLGLPRVTSLLLQAALSRWVRIFTWRRPAMGIFDQAWRVISRVGAERPLPLVAKEELLRAVCA